MTEGVQAWFLGLRRGGALTREGAPPLLPIERPANLQERKDQQSGHAREPGAGAQAATREAGPQPWPFVRLIFNKKAAEQGSPRS